MTNTINNTVKDPDYWYKAIRPVHNLNHKLVKKRIKNGWEIESHDGHLLVLKKRKTKKINLVKG